MGLRPDPSRSAEPSAATKESPGRQEKKTSPAQAETAEPPSRAPLLILREKMRKRRVPRAAMPEVELGEQGPLSQPMRRQSPGNRPHSAQRRAPSRASAEAL